MTLSITNIILKPSAGTCAPPWEKGRAWPLWVEKATLKAPKLIRFVWCANSGQLWAGLACDHQALLTDMEESQAKGPMLTGYSLPTSQTVVVKEVVESLSAPTPASTEVIDDVIDGFVALLRPTLPKHALIFRDANNPFLMSRLSKLAE